MRLSAEQIADGSQGILRQKAEAGTFQFDTRILEPSQWFLAFKGVRDGHDFISTALEKGCAGVLGQHVPEGWSKGFVEVENTLIAFQNIARWLRSI